MLAYGYHDQQFNPKDVHGSHFYTDYVSNWNDMSCSIWAVLNAVLAFCPQTHGALYAGVSAFNAIAPTFSIGVAGAFWCLLPKERQSTDIVSLHQHAFLAIITVIDLIFTAAPIRNRFEIFFSSYFQIAIFKASPDRSYFIFEFNSRSMSDLTLSDIDFKNKMAWV